MTKKRNSILTLATIIAMVMLLALAVPAYADNEQELPTIIKSTGTEDSPAKAAITKMLRMPVGTITPETYFTFDFVGHSYDGHIDETNKDILPPIQSVNTQPFTFESFALPIVDGIKYVPQEVPLFEGVVWPGAGVYAYTVKEKQIGAYNDGRASTFETQWAYSDAEYLIRVYVVNRDDKLGVYAESITAQIIKQDSSQTTTGKVDPTPKDPERTNDFSKLIFTNTYLKNNGEIDPLNPKTVAVLTLEKMVDGKLGSLVLPFTFNVKVNNPKTVSDQDNKYRAYVIDVGGVLIGDLSNNHEGGTIKQDSHAKNYIEFTPGTAVNVKLQHGEKLIFTDLPVGADFDVTENATQDYAPSYEVTTENPSSGEADYNFPLSIPSSIVADIGFNNSVTFTNRFVDSISETGISVENLPYVILIAVALLALIAYLVIKSRRNAKFDF
jgi:hypothetical protein